jgi:hypothetical protein
MDAADAAIASINAASRRRAGNAFWRLEQQRLVDVLTQWLAVEVQRESFAVVQREQDMPFNLAGLALQLRADRIDRLNDGSFLIIDYKSHTCSVQDWLGERPSQPQLPLYSIVSSPLPSSLAFATVSPRNCRFTGLGRVAAAPGISADIERTVKAKMTATDWSQVNQSWQTTLTRLAQSFVEGAAAVNPMSLKTCSNCGLQSLCRINSVTGSVDDDTADPGAVRLPVSPQATAQS